MQPRSDTRSVAEIMEDGVSGNNRGHMRGVFVQGDGEKCVIKTSDGCEL